jgi:predicted TIM-barrel fold metal-dependent hydrolase
VDWSQWKEKGPAFPEWAAGRLRLQKERGAQGLKIWKSFGLHVRDQDDRLAKVDDARLEPIWETAGELGLPVVIHVADPVAFFDAVDETNERWEELQAHPDWAFTSPPFPPFMDIMGGLRNLVRRHKGTTFIGAHVGCYGENLEWVGRMLDECPNYFIDISARLGELGRQPYTARRFFLKYQDRILFGSDMSPDLEAYRLYYRFLETEDEYFNYNTGDVPGQGRWYVCGLFLEEDVLSKVYRGNAERVLKI